jgi:hypothetical protein
MSYVGKFPSKSGNNGKVLKLDTGDLVYASGGGGGADWGDIGGTLSDQTDLQTALNGKQNELVSGTNIKTVNSTSILGSGDISIPTGQSLIKRTDSENNISVTNVAATISTKTLTVAQGDIIRVLVRGNINNASGGTRSYSIILNIGGTTMTVSGSTTINTATLASVWYDGTIDIYDDTQITMQGLFTTNPASADNASVTAVMRSAWRTVGVNRIGSQAVTVSIISSNTGTQTFKGIAIIEQIPSIA